MCVCVCVCVGVSVLHVCAFVSCLCLPSLGSVVSVGGATAGATSDLSSFLILGSACLYVGSPWFLSKQCALDPVLAFYVEAAAGYAVCCLFRVDRATTI